MRRKDESKDLATMLIAMEARVAACHHETIAVVEIADYRQVKERDERQLLTIATLEAERAQLRMLLKEALGQLERIFTTTKVASPEYRRLMARCDAVLSPKAVEP